MNKLYLSVALLVCLAPQIHAFKLMAPEMICQQRGLSPNSPEWQACINEANAENGRMTKEFYLSVNARNDRMNNNPTEPTQEELNQEFHILPYMSEAQPVSDVSPVAPRSNGSAGSDTGVVSPLMRKSLTRKLTNGL